LVSELGSKIRFTFCFLLSFYLFFRFCSYSLFFVFVLCTKLKKKKKKKKKKRKKEKEEVILKHQVEKKKEVILKQQILSFYLLKVTLFLNCDFCSFSSLKQKKKKKDLIFFSFSSLISCFCHIFPCCWYWFKFCKLNFLIKFISFRKN
jgi:uncharacterized ion transporter superfamily protein YfcC